MITCLGDVWRPAAGKATVALLRRLGHHVDFPDNQTCCGRPMFDSGFTQLACEQAKHTIQAFRNAPAVIVPSASCSAMVKMGYPRLLAGDRDWHTAAIQLAERTFELSDFLVNQLGVVDVGARFEGTVTYHDACQLRPLGQSGTVEKLIEHVEGATYVPLARQDQCCGFGGSFAVRYPHLSAAMVDDKVRCVLESGAEAVISTDAGCLMNIGGRLHREGQSVEVLHLAELLDLR